tara:strand:+ start:155 stop:1897 length:1743 start_codon:yes stop_codon:yes gene_type:complete
MANAETSEEASQKSGASISATTMNLLNCLEGMGILAMPYCMMQLGWAAVLLVVLVGAASAYTAHLLVRSMYDSDAVRGSSDVLLDAEGGDIGAPLLSGHDRALSNLVGDGEAVVEEAGEQRVAAAVNAPVPSDAHGAASPQRIRWTYGEVGEAAFGPLGRVCVAATQTTLILSVAVLYLVLVGSSLADLVPSFGPWSVDVGQMSLHIPHVTGVATVRVWTGLAWLVTAPTAWLPSMKYVAAFSGVAIASLVIASLLVYATCAMDVVTHASGHAASSDVAPWTTLRNLPFLIPSALPTVFGVIAFAFTCHGQLPAIEGGMSITARRRFPRVLFGTFGVAIVLKATFMIAGFAAFGAATSDVVSTNIRPFWGRIAADVLVTVNTLLTVPLPLFACVYVATTLFGVESQKLPSQTPQTLPQTLPQTTPPLALAAASASHAMPALAALGGGTPPVVTSGGEDGVQVNASGGDGAVEERTERCAFRRRALSRNACVALALRFILVLVVGALAVSIPDFALVMSVVGAALGTLISFVFPIAFYAKLRWGVGELSCAHGVALAALLLCTGGAGGATLVLHIVTLATA